MVPKYVHCTQAILPGSVEDLSSVCWFYGQVWLRPRIPVDLQFQWVVAEVEYVQESGSPQMVPEVEHGRHYEHACLEGGPGGMRGMKSFR